MPSSKRPSPRAAMDDADTDADADGLRDSPPRPKKRSSRPKSGRRSPNPNPRPRGDYYGTEPSRKSERKRKPRTFPDAASLSRAVVARPASPSRGGGGGSGGSGLLWTDADEVALLTGAVAFRAGSGRAPRLPDTGPLFESIRDSLSPHIDQAKVYYKLKRLKSKFCNTALTANSSLHERRVRDLSADLWGPDLAPRVAEEDAVEEAEEDDDDEGEDAGEGYAAPEVAVGPRLPLVNELLGEYWRRNARALSGVSLEKGLALIDADEGKVAETKWRRQLDAEMQTQMRRHDLAKEVFGLLIDTVKGLGP